MKNKKCFKCGEVKPLKMFYKHPQMGDGHLNKCIECTKKDTATRTNFLMETDPDYIEKERKRGRDKFRRLYRESPKPYKRMVKYENSFMERYPEKYRSYILSQRVKAPEGKVKHHWSYKEEHAKIVIFLTPEEHCLIHRYITYDQERKMYRSLDGVLLDSKERHYAYFWNFIKNKEKI